MRSRLRLAITRWRCSSTSSSCSPRTIASLALADLADEPWVQGVRRGSTLNILPAACVAAGFTPRIAFRTDDIAAV
jgi:hypothetical protein